MGTYHRPGTLDEALSIRAARPVTVLAGGTDVYPAKAARAGWGDMRQPDILDISRIPGLRGIEERPDHWRIGALTTWTDVLQAKLPPLFDGLKLAAREVGGVQIQNRGTLGGNVCTASPAGDGAPNLLALDAAIELASRTGTRQIAMQEFIDDYRHTRCRADEIVTAFIVPKRGENARGSFLKLGARKYLVISIVMVAGVIETGPNGTIGSLSFGIGSCSAVPQRLLDVEAALIGQPIAGAADLLTDEHLACLAPIDDIRGSAAYRRHAALVLVTDLLAEHARWHGRKAA